MVPLAYFITFHTHGSWLHGRDLGSVDREHNEPGAPFLPADRDLESRRIAAMKSPPFELDAFQRFVVDSTLLEVCQFRHWELHAKHVRSTHVHGVVSANHVPERVMNDLKAYCTRRMREAGVLDQNTQPWSYHGSTRYLNASESVERAVDYVLHQQGEPLEMKCPPGWISRVNPNPAE